MEGTAGTHVVTASRPLVLAGTRRRTATVLAWGAWSAIVLAVGVVCWMDLLLRDEGRADLSAMSDGGVAFAAGMLVAATLGAVTASRTQHPVSWLLLGLSGTVVASGVAHSYAGYGAIADPGSLPAARWVASFAEAMFFLSSGSSR